MAGQGELDKRLIVAGVIAAVGLVMLIAGSVMLGIGVHKSHQKSDCPTCQTCPQPTCQTCPSIAPTAVFTSSYDKSTPYTADLANPNSTAFLTTAAALAQNITSLLSASVSAQKFSMLAVTQGTTVVINSFQPSTNNIGVNFYASIIFPYNGMSATNVQKQMSTAYPTNANPSPTAQCNSLAVPPGEPVVTASTVPPSTTTTVKPLPEGAYCDASQKSLLQVFLIDASMPSYGTLDSKLATIRLFLQNYDTFVNLHSNGSWGSVGFMFVTYGTDFSAPSDICYDDLCWHTMIDSLIPIVVNPNNLTSHYLSSGLKTVNASVPLNYGQARNLLILSDGFDITDNNSTYWANVLKMNYFQIGAFLASTNPIISSIFDSVVTSVAYRFDTSSWDYLNYSPIDSSMASWSCGTTYPTPAPTTPRPTPPTIKTTTTTTTTTASPIPTTRSGPLPLPDCTVDLLFLVDESLSMLTTSGYNQSLQYTQTIAQQVSSTNKNSRFAIITFNSVVVYQSPSYVGYNDFVGQVNNISRYEGSTDFIVGFTAARQVVNSSRFSQDGIRSVVVFLSDGFNDNSSSIETVKGISHDMRVNYATELIALGLNENAFGQQLTQEAIEYGADDGYVASQYINVATVDSVTSAQTINSTLTSIICKGPNVTLTCSTDITFVIEVSEAEADVNIEIQRQSVNGLINHYKKIIGPGLGEVSLVYFSAPDGLTTAEHNRSGILYTMVDSSTQAISYLNNKDFHPLGGASDINLAMNMVLQVLAFDLDNNDQLVVFFGRGTYDDGASNCCNNPNASAAAVRSKATVQGVVIGDYSNIALMNTLTGSVSIDGNSLMLNNSVTNTTDIGLSAQAIQNALVTKIDAHLANVYCAPLPTLVGPCQEFDDIVVILHASSADNWSIVKDFVIQDVIPSLTGAISVTGQYPGLFVNLAVVTYFGQTVTTIGDFTSSTQQMADALNAMPFAVTTETNSLSQAYKSASDLQNNGRALASKTVLVVTDRLDIADYDSEVLQRNRMNNTFVYGLLLNSTQSGAIVPGQDDGLAINDIQQIKTSNPRTSIAIANDAYNGVCRIVTITTLPPVTLPTPKPTPGPVPAVKPRDVWPDVTLLIDASQQDPSFFELQRQFLRSTFLSQFRIGDSWSRHAVATYNNGTKMVCYFSDITNYWDLEECLGSRLTYSGSVSPSSSQRYIGQALQSLQGDLFSLDRNTVARTGYKSLKTNYLYVLTNGVSGDNFYQAATNLKLQGVRVVGIDISSTSAMNSTMLSDFGPDSYSVSNFANPIISNELSSSILKQATSKPRPALSSLFSDFYFIVDNSGNQAADLPNVQAFIKKFVEQLTVSPHRSRVSIVPFSDDVNNPLGLSTNMTTVTSYITNWMASPSNTSNIAPAITYVQTMASVDPTKTSHVIYLVGAKSTIGADSAQSLWAHVTDSFVLDYSKTNYSGKLTNDATKLFGISGSGSLLNWVDSFPVNVKGFNQMTQFFYTIQDSEDQADFANFPQKEVQADIMIFLDETGLSPADFTSVKQFLSDFVNQFTIGPMDTQFALQSFSAQLIPHSGWHFSDSTSNTDLLSRISSLTLTNSSADQPADLAGAVDQGMYFFLQPANGWRESVSTYTVIITNANSFVNSSTDASLISSLQSLTQVFAISTNGANSSYVAQWVNTQFYETTANPQALNNGNGAGKDLSGAINTDYKQQVYPPFAALNAIPADFIFLVDNINATQNRDAISQFLLKFVAFVGVEGVSHVSVISYNSVNIFPDSTWTLRSYTKGQQELNTRLRGLTVSNDTNPANLNAAVGLFAGSPMQYGIDASRPVFVISLFNSQTLSSDLSTAVMSSVNLKYFTYAIQYGGNSSPLPYLQSFLGVDYSEDWLYVKDLGSYDTTPNNVFNQLHTYIQSGYAAWKNTYASN